jgi:hypothetical protein
MSSSRSLLDVGFVSILATVFPPVGIQTKSMFYIADFATRLGEPNSVSFPRYARLLCDQHAGHLSVLLYLQGLRTTTKTTARRLLRVLFLWLSALPTDSKSRKNRSPLKLSVISNKNQSVSSTVDATVSPSFTALLQV